MGPVNVFSFIQLSNFRGQSYSKIWRADVSEALFYGENPGFLKEKWLTRPEEYNPIFDSQSP